MFYNYNSYTLIDKIEYNLSLYLLHYGRGNYKQQRVDIVLYCILIILHTSTYYYELVGIPSSTSSSASS